MCLDVVQETITICICICWKTCYIQQLEVNMPWSQTPSTCCLQEGLVADLKEADLITSLCSVGAGLFAYTLSNCTVGVYYCLQRSWRVKSKHAVNCICAHDNSEGGPGYLISGWSNGKVCICLAGIVRLGQCHDTHRCIFLAAHAPQARSPPCTI